MTASPSARPSVRPALAGAPFAIRPELLAIADPVICEICENDLYLETVIIRRLSALLSPSGRVEMMRFPVLACSQCGHVNVGFLPPGVTREIGHGGDDPGEPGDMGEPGEP
jgi:hypothetical protein